MATKRTQLPGLPAVRSTGDASRDAWMRAVAEHLEVWKGSRGDTQQRVVSLAELEERLRALAWLEKRGKTAAGGKVVLDLGNNLSAVVDAGALSGTAQTGGSGGVTEMRVRALLTATDLALRELIAQESQRLENLINSKPSSGGVVENTGALTRDAQAVGAILTGMFVHEFWGATYETVDEDTGEIVTETTWGCVPADGDHPATGFSMEDYEDGDTVTVYTLQNPSNEYLEGLMPGATYYLGDAGGVSLTGSQWLGTAMDGETLALMPAEEAVGGFVPFLVEAGVTFRVPANKQALFAMGIELEDGAALDVEGALVEVN